MQGRVTSRDVARAAGVSQNTVSLVIHDSPRVRPETKATVRAAMKRLGYHPNAVAAALRTRSTPVLLFVVHKGTIHDHVTAELLAGAVEGAERYEDSVLVVAVDDSARAAVKAFHAGWASGSLVFAVGPNDRVVAELTSAGCPTVSLLQPSRDCPPEWVVRADDAGGARQAIAHLLQCGHTRIGLVTARLEPDADGPAFQRTHAACEAAQQGGATLVPSYTAAWTTAGGLQAGRALLQSSPRPTAIFAISDRAAFGVLQAAREQKLRVPEDLAVVGFDDTEWAQYCDPPLTTVEFPLRAIGRLGAERLLGPAPTELAPVPTRLIIRQST